VKAIAKTDECETVNITRVRITKYLVNSLLTE